MASSLVPAASSGSFLISPNVGLMIWTLLLFGISMYVLAKLAFPRITEALEIPTIGIGAGPDTDGQVLVFHDILGLTNHPPAKFVRQYAQLGNEITEAIGRFAADVRSGAFPNDTEVYANPEDLLN